ncbi:23S rRNA (adenine(2503)-C(2))-methyltransferase RlmN [Treponema sp.]
MDISTAKYISDPNQTGPRDPRGPRLLGLSSDSLAAVLKSYGEPSFRTAQIFDWLYKKDARSFDEMKNIPLPLREKLAAEFELGREEPRSVSESTDGTKKYLFAVNNAGPGATGPRGTKFIESAFIPDEDRATLCVSTQVGCKMGCLFCATGRQGFQGQLDAGAIVNQLLSLPERSRITNIVYMGMGEPLDNIEGSFGSLELFTSPKAIGMSSKRITLSTIGLPGPLKTYLDTFDSHLAISIHSPFDEERASLMPIQRTHKIRDIIDLLRHYHFDDHRRLSFEYIMFAGINDSLEHARELVRLVNGLNCRVNLIHYHSVPGNDLQGADRSVMESFQNLLKEKGIMATIRKSRGEDIQAACGLLSTKALLSPDTDADY